MTMEEFFNLMVARTGLTDEDEALVDKVAAWLKLHPTLCLSLVQRVGLDVVVGVVFTWYAAYRRGLPMGLEDIIPDEYKR